MIRRSVIWVVVFVVMVVVVALNPGDPYAIGALVFWAIIVGVAAGSAALSYRYWSWVTTEDAVEIRHGVINRHVSVVPYHRIQQIDIDRDPIERMLGIATLVLRSAAATTDAKIPGIALDDCDAFRRALLARTGSDDAV